MSPWNDAKVSIKHSCVKLHRSLLGIWCSPMRPPWTCLRHTVPWVVLRRESMPQWKATFSVVTGKHSSPTISTISEIASRYSVLPALSLDGIIYVQIVHGSLNGTTFNIFLEGLLLHMNPYPTLNSVLVMHNCAIHHVEGVQEMCDERWVADSCCHCSNIAHCFQWCQVIIPSAVKFHPIHQISTPLRSASHLWKPTFAGMGLDSAVK